LPVKNAWTCSRLRCSPFSMLINNPQHPLSFPFQAHPALETHGPFRLIRH
jgi:hypothetical protein